MASKTEQFSESVLAHINVLSETLGQVSAGLGESAEQNMGSAGSEQVAFIESRILEAIGMIQSASDTLGQAERQLRAHGHLCQEH